MMKQTSLAAAGGFELKTRRTRKQVFLSEMQAIVPWAELVAIITPYAPAPGPRGGRPPFAVETMLRIHFMQQWFGLSDPAMEEALYDVPLYRQFAGLDIGVDRLPDESTILRFRHLLEEHRLSLAIFDRVNALLARQGLMLRAGTAVDATIIAAPSSTKNSTGTRDPEMHQTKKGNQWHFGLKAHIGVDAESGLVHTMVTTPANAHDVTQVHELLHGQETDVFADSGYRGAHKREEVKKSHPKPHWHIAMMPGKRRVLDRARAHDRLVDELERTKARIRAKVEHPFRVLKCQFGFTKVRYKGLAKNTANLATLFALANLWMARKRILQACGG